MKSGLKHYHTTRKISYSYTHRKIDKDAAKIVWNFDLIFNQLWLNELFQAKLHPTFRWQKFIEYFNWKLSIYWVFPFNQKRLKFCILSHWLGSEINKKFLCEKYITGNRHYILQKLTTPNHVIKIIHRNHHSRRRISLFKLMKPCRHQVSWKYPSRKPPLKLEWLQYRCQLHVTHAYTHLGPPCIRKSNCEDDNVNTLQCRPITQWKFIDWDTKVIQKCSLTILTNHSACISS